MGALSHLCPVPVPPPRALSHKGRGDSGFSAALQLPVPLARDVEFHHVPGPRSGPTPRLRFWIPGAQKLLGNGQRLGKPSAWESRAPSTGLPPSHFCLPPALPALALLPPLCPAGLTLPCIGQCGFSSLPPSQVPMRSSLSPWGLLWPHPPSYLAGSPNPGQSLRPTQRHPYGACPAPPLPACGHTTLQDPQTWACVTCVPSRSPANALLTLAQAGCSPTAASRCRAIP